MEDLKAFADGEAVVVDTIDDMMKVTQALEVLGVDYHIKAHYDNVEYRYFISVVKSNEVKLVGQEELKEQFPHLDIPDDAGFYKQVSHFTNEEEPMMEKYGTEIQTYEVVQIIPHQPDDKKVVANGMTMDEAESFAKKNEHYMVRPEK